MVKRMLPHEIQAARHELGMTQRELGVFLELENDGPERTVRRWETGTRAIPGPVKVALALKLREERKRKGKVTHLLDRARPHKTRCGQQAAGLLAEPRFTAAISCQSCFDLTLRGKIG